MAAGRRLGGLAQALCNGLIFNYTAGRRHWGRVAFPRRFVADRWGVGFHAGAISGRSSSCRGRGAGRRISTGF